MGQPVKLSDGLVLDARIAGEAQQRSIAGQVEFWAKLGRAVEVLLDGNQVQKLHRTHGRPLSELLSVVDTPKGRRMLRAYLDSEPFPHYEAHPAGEGMLIRTEAGGKRTVGRFVNRVFVPDEGETRTPPAGRTVKVRRAAARSLRASA